MDAELAVSQILDDEGLTSDLDEAEATALANWLVGEVQKIAKAASSEETGWKQIKARRQQAKKFARAVALFRDQGVAQASQYARQEHLPWPTTPPSTAKQVMDHLLHSVK